MSHDLQLLIPSKFDRWVVRDEMSLRFDPKIPEHIFLEVLSVLLHAQTKIEFYIGDAINFASKKCEKGRYTRFLQVSGYTYVRLKAFAWVARAIPPERRRPDLSFTYHEHVAGYTAEQQARILAAAAKNQWPIKKLREHLKLLGKGPSKTPPQTQYGEALDFPGLRRAPINELGVVFLFGLLSKKLDFDVEAIHSAFPDCIAKRLIDRKRNRWKQVRIEFEYLSRNFLLHQHEHEHCDLIVCWIHDWRECPTTIEVIALKDEIDKLRRESSG